MATFTVTSAADTVDAGDGALSLREAVQRANAAAGTDTITFAAGLEGGTLTLTQGQLTLSDGTVIDGDSDNNGSRVVLSGGNASRVLETVDGVGAELRDLTVADGTVANATGAGVRVGGGGSLTVRNCTVRDCDAGEIFVAGGSGGGIALGANARLDIAGSTVSGNSAYGLGGGISGAAGSRIYMRDSAVSGNVAETGAGIDARGYVSITTTTVQGNGVNTYNNDVGSGGGLYASGPAVVARSLFAGNSAPDGGGIAAGSLTISDSTVAANSASGDEFPGQTGGVSGGDVTLIRATVTGNSTSNDGVYYTGAAGVQARSLRVYDSIVVGNRNLEGPSDVGGSLAFSNGRNLFGGVVAGSVPGDLGNVAAATVFAAVDPLTGGGRLALNGGPTRTVALRNAADNPALNAAEPADAGDVDQRGVTRPQPGTTNPDLGAFELAQSAVSTAASARNDVLTGTAAADTVSGLAGADLIRGLGGNDRLFGNAGSDTLRGEAGDDLLEGGPGSDWLYGGAGTDQVSYFNDVSPAGVSVNLNLGRATRGGEVDRLFEVENVDGGDNADLLLGNAGANRLGGAGGADTVQGLASDDVLVGGLGNDTLDGDAGLDLADYAAGGAVTIDLSLAADRATCGTESDTLREIEGAIGSAGADVFRGDGAANLFRGASGKDRQTGGGGADRFDFDALADSPAGANRDVVTDFAHLSDRIDLATIDARAATPAVNDVFAFLAARGAAFNGAGQVRWLQAGGNTLVEASTDADAAAELQIELSGLKTVSAADFVL